MGLKEILLGTNSAPVETRGRAEVDATYSISDPSLAAYFLDMYGIGGLDVSETKALGLPAYYRAVSVVSGTVAGLPLKTYSDSGGERKQVKSFLDNPAGPYPLSSFAWKELVMLHLINQGEVFLMHVYNNAGSIIGLWPVHRNAVEDVTWHGYEKRFKVRMIDNTTQEFDSFDMTHIMGMTIDGTRGIAPISLFRQSIKLGMAAEVAATRNLTKGLHIAGLVTPDDDITEDEAKIIKAGLMNKIAGVENAGEIAVVNRVMKFTPWQMSNRDAQFIESREFQAIEFARMIGVPPHLIGATEKQTSWGTGVAEQNAGLARYTLKAWTSRLEEPLSDLLPNPRFCEFEYKGLLQGTPQEEIALLINQVKAGLLTKNEARAIMNLSPLEGGDQNEQTDSN